MFVCVVLTKHHERVFKKLIIELESEKDQEEIKRSDNFKCTAIVNVFGFVSKKWTIPSIKSKLFILLNRVILFSSTIENLILVIFFKNVCDSTLHRT